MSSRRRILKTLGTAIPVLTLTGSKMAAAASVVDCTTPPISDDAAIFPVDEQGNPVNDWSAALVDENGELYYFMTDDFTMGTASASCIASIQGFDI